MQVFIGLGADLMLENGLKKAFSDNVRIFSASQPHLSIFTLDLARSQSLHGDLGDLPVHCDAGR